MINLNSRTLADIEALPVKRPCDNCGVVFTTVGGVQRICKFCRSADDDLRMRLRPPSQPPLPDPPEPEPAPLLAKPGALLWTQERLDELQRLAGRDMSASEIAAALNARFETEISRSAVIGKLDRLGIKMKGARTALTVRPARPSRPRPAKPYLILLTPDEHLDDLHTLSSLPPGACKWPITGKGKDMRFCGQDGVPQRPYCRGHLQKAFLKKQEIEQ